jgi:hypothetical protein
MKRKRGAPIGNQNAFKHGFYSSHFRKHEQSLLEEHASPDLVDEIGLLRVATARFLASLQQGTSPHDIQTELAILRAINLGALSINSLVRTRLMLAGAGPAQQAVLQLLGTPPSDPEAGQQT